MYNFLYILQLKMFKKIGIAATQMWIIFCSIFYITQYVQTIIFLTCNQQKNYYWDIFHFFFF